MSQVIMGWSSALFVLLLIPSTTALLSGTECPEDPYFYMDDPEVACSRSEASPVCEGHGQCVCGQCQCDPVTPSQPHRKYSGQFCECDDFSCDYYGGQICGGPARGRCMCGRCLCTQGYMGADCSCATSTETCVASNGLLCNGRGDCDCGVCTCHDNHYRGATCEECPTCPGQCTMKKACVQCSAFMMGPLSARDCADTCGPVHLVDELEDTPSSRRCQFRDDDGCMFHFSYDVITGNTHVQRNKDCPHYH